MVSDFYPPIIGGMERHVSLLAKALADRGHEVIVCTMRRERFRKVGERHGVKIVRLDDFLQKIPFLFKGVKKKYPPLIN